MKKFILVIFFSLVYMQGKAQGGHLSIPSDIQEEILDYVKNQNIDAYENRFSSSKEEGKIFTWQVPMSREITKKVCIYSPEKLVEDDNLSSRVNITYKQKLGEVSFILWVRDKDGDVFGVFLEKIQKNKKNHIVKNADLSGFQERFTKIL